MFEFMRDYCVVKRINHWCRMLYSARRDEDRLIDMLTLQAAYVSHMIEFMSDEISAEIMDSPWKKNAIRDRRVMRALYGAMEVFILLLRSPDRVGAQVDAQELDSAHSLIVLDVMSPGRG